MLRHAEHQEKKAKIQWLKAREKVEACDRQLHELVTYADDYHAATANAGRVAELVNRKHFVARLDVAITQQKLMCEQARQTESAYLGRWQKEKQHLKALERLKEQRIEAVMQHKSRNEQRALDEFALQSLGRQK